MWLVRLLVLHQNRIRRLLARWILVLLKGLNILKLGQEILVWCRLDTFCWLLKGVLLILKLGEHRAELLLILEIRTIHRLLSELIILRVLYHLLSSLLGLLKTIHRVTKRFHVI